MKSKEEEGDLDEDIADGQLTLVPNETNSSDFDTDLEEEEKQFRMKEQKQHKTYIQNNAGVGHVTYTEVCRRLGAVPIRRISEQLHFHEMRVQHVGMNNDHCRALACALWHNTCLEILDLEDNGLSSEDMIPVINIFKNNIYISSLSLSGNVVDVDGAMAINDVLCETEFLTHLNLSGTRLGDKEIEYIADGIQHNSSLRWLDLSHNEISIAGSKRLGRAIGHTMSIQFLDLSWNHIRLSGAVALCKGLQINNSIINLNLSMNGLGFEGSLALEEMLRENTCLKFFDVSNNRINWEGVSYVAKGIRRNVTLQMLKIGNNPINMEGCYGLLKAVASKKSGMIHLGLDNIPLNGVVLNVADEIQKTRQFSITHGGILETRDVVGIRKEKPEDPISLVVRYLGMVGIRIIDLFRMFDTRNDGQVSREHFIRGLKRIGCPLGDRELANVASRLDKRKKGFISYSNLANGVRNHIREERKEDRRQEVRKRNKLEERRRILQTELPPLYKKTNEDDMFLFYASQSSTNLASHRSSTASMVSTAGGQATILPPISALASTPNIREDTNHSNLSTYNDEDATGFSATNSSLNLESKSEKQKPFKLLKYLNAYLDRRKTQANFDISVLPNVK